jgi:putative oxidoreductase
MLKKLLSPVVFSVNLAALVLRITFCGLMIFNHAFIKLTLFGERPESFPDPLGLGSSTSYYLVIFAEIICASLVLIGLFTRLALAPLLITMMVALFKVQWANELTDKELPLLYLAVWVALMLLGPGRWSVDWRIMGSKG